MSPKPIASVSLDLDNQWAYLKSVGNSDWESFPSYLEVIVPRILNFLAEHEMQITFFVVGKDAEMAENKKPLQMIVDSGHEIANHSYMHEPWLHLYSKEKLVAEFEKSEKAIFETTGVRTTGFRGPGFSLTDEVLKQLVARGYRYDATTFPTFLGPVARMYFQLKAKFNRRQKEERKALFGKVSDGFQRLRPYHWISGADRLLELPVTTMPFAKVPVHASYLMYLAGYSPLLARIYWRMSISMCRLSGVNPSFLLHPTDFLGAEDIDDSMKFFPAMKLSAKKKIGLLHNVMDILKASYRPVTMEAHAAYAAKTARHERPMEEAIVEIEPGTILQTID